MQGKLHCDIFNLNHYMVNSVAISPNLKYSELLSWEMMH